MANILIIDDDREICKVLEQILEAESHSVLSVHSGEDGLRWVENNSIDLAIVDLIMPDKDGLEVILTMKKDHPKLLIIAITGGGYGSPTDYLTLADAFGADRTLAKPFNREDLLGAVDNCLKAGSPDNDIVAG